MNVEKKITIFVMDFENFLVPKCPESVMYVPNFISSAEEKLILSNIERTPKPKWTQLMNRRLINFGGVPHPRGMFAEELPAWLQSYMDKINNLGIFDAEKANHVLINEYLPGQGIMPHTDGPLFHPIISTITCGSHCVLEFSSNVEATEADTKHSVHFKLLVEPRSLLIIKDKLYTDYMHGISELTEDVLCDKINNYEHCEHKYKKGERLKRGTRISLTIRHVPKTSKFNLKF